MSAPVPWTGRRSNKDSEKARAAEHANTALHRRMYRLDSALHLKRRLKGFSLGKS